MKALILFLLLGASAVAQNIVLKDNKTVVTKGVRRQGDNIVAMVDIPGQDKPGEMAYPISQITRVEFPEPGQLRAAAELMNQGKYPEAVAQLDSALKYYDGIREVPGSWWSLLAVRRMQALAAAGREKDVEAQAEVILQRATEPSVKAAANVQFGVIAARKGDFTRALTLVEPALASSKDPETLAAAYLVKGQSMLEKKEWEDAILAFVQIPVFYPNEKSLMPPALLGRGKAHFALDDFATAKTVLNELVKSYPNSPEAKAAATELEKVARREKALSPT